MRSAIKSVIVICAAALLSFTLTAPATASTADTIPLAAAVRPGSSAGGNSELNDNLALLKVLLETTLNSNSNVNLSDTLVIYRLRFQNISGGINQQFDTLAAILRRTPALSGKLAEISNTRDEINGKFQVLDQKISELLTLYADQNTSPVVLTGKIKELIEFITTNSIFERSTLIGSGELPHRTFSPERLWGGQVGSIGFWSPNVPASTSGEQPSSGDLASTEEVTATDKIIGLVSALDSNPLAIYQYVKNNIEYAPYYGSMKSADEVLRQHSGNDIDIAHLMIALLRATGIPARYTYGTVEIPIERAKNWIGITDEATLIRFLACNGMPTTAVYGVNGLKAVRIEHMWVDAYVNYGPYGGAVTMIGEQRWVPLDASIRAFTETPSVDVSGAVPFDGMAYIESDTDLPPFLYFMDKVREYLRTSYSDSTELGEVFLNRNRKPENLNRLPIDVPYRVIEFRGRYSELPDILRHKVRFGVNINGSVANKELSVYELQGKRLTLSYAPATAADKAVMDEYDGYYNPPAFLVKLKPQIQIEGEPIITGSEIGLGASHQFDIDFIFPGGIIMDRVSNNMVAGEYYGIAVVAGQPPSISLAERNKLFDQNNNLPIISVVENPEQYSQTLFNPYLRETNLLESSRNPSDNLTGELLYQTAIEYFNNLYHAEKILGNLLRVIHTVQPMVSITGLKTEIGHCFLIPSSIKIVGGFIDVDRHLYGMGSVSGRKADEIKFLTLAGYSNSFWEHEVFAKIFRANAVSTISILKSARQQGIRLITIGNDNLEQAIWQVALSETDREEIRDYVRTGNVVIIPQTSPEISGKHCMGFLVHDPRTGAGAFMIEDQFAGATTLFPISGVYGNGASLVSFYLQWDNIMTNFEEYFLSLVERDLIRAGYNTRIFESINSPGEFLTAVVYSTRGLLYLHEQTLKTDINTINYKGKISGPYTDIITASNIKSHLEALGGIGPRIVINMSCYSSVANYSDAYFIDGRYFKYTSDNLYEMHVGWTGENQAQFNTMIGQFIVRLGTFPIPGTGYLSLGDIVNNFEFYCAYYNLSLYTSWKAWRAFHPTAGDMSYFPAGIP